MTKILCLQYIYQFGQHTAKNIYSHNNTTEFSKVVKKTKKVRTNRERTRKMRFHCCHTILNKSGYSPSHIEQKSHFCQIYYRRMKKGIVTKPSKKQRVVPLNLLIELCGIYIISLFL